MKNFLALAGAACVCTLSLTPATGNAAVQAGVAAGVSGAVNVSEGERTEATTVLSGMEMLLGDKVRSAEASRMQILLLDETVFTVGPSSELVIDEFIYDPASSSGALTANFTKGVLRYVSGRIAAASSTAVTIQTRTATIGVRGTALFAVDDPESANNETFIGLLGPGANNDGNLKAGGMTVSNEFGAVDVLRAGFGTFVSEGGAPGAPVPTPLRLTRLMQGQLTGAMGRGAARGEQGGQNGQGGGNGGNQQADNNSSDQGGPGANSSDQGGAGGGGQVPGGGQASAASGQGAAQTAVGARNVSVPLRNVQNIGDLAARATEEGAGRGDDENPQVAIEDMVEVAQELGFGSLPFGVDIPAAVELTWANINDLDLHLTGPNPGGMDRFHVFFSNRGNFDGSPFAQLDADRTGTGGSEVIGLSQLNQGGVYRASVFNFGDSGVESTSLSNDADARIRVITNGRISRGATGSTIISGTVLQSVTPLPGQTGNTWVAVEFNPNLDEFNVVNQFVNSAGSAAVQ